MNEIIIAFASLCWGIIGFVYFFSIVYRLDGAVWWFILLCGPIVWGCTAYYYIRQLFTKKN